MQEAEQRTGRKIILILTPHFNILPERAGGAGPGAGVRRLQAAWAPRSACPTRRSPTRCSTGCTASIRDIDIYTQDDPRARHDPRPLHAHAGNGDLSPTSTGADVETYIQIYNAAGFLMQVEVDWVMRIIRNAKKPVMTIKPLAAGRLLPPVGLAFVWNTIRDQDMVTIGTHHARRGAASPSSSRSTSSTAACPTTSCRPRAAKRCWLKSRFRARGRSGIISFDRGDGW